MSPVSNDLSELSKSWIEFIKTHETNFKGVGQPLRIALTGSKFGPGLYDIILSLDKEIVSNRIKKLFGYTVVLNKPEINSSTYINSIKVHNIHKVQPLQSAAVVLTNEEILIALEIFKESISKEITALIFAVVT